MYAGTMDDIATEPATGPSAWDVLEAEGVDLSLLESNLRKTPLERIRAHDRAVTTALALRSAMEESHARTRIAS